MQSEPLSLEACLWAPGDFKQPQRVLGTVMGHTSPNHNSTFLTSKPYILLYRYFGPFGSNKGILNPERASKNQDKNQLLARKSRPPKSYTLNPLESNLPYLKKRRSQIIVNLWGNRSLMPLNSYEPYTPRPPALQP